MNHVHNVDVFNADFATFRPTSIAHDLFLRYCHGWWNPNANATYILLQTNSKRTWVVASEKEKDCLLTLCVFQVLLVSGCVWWSLDWYRCKETITCFNIVPQHESPQNHLQVTTKHLVLEALLPPNGWQCNPGRNLVIWNAAQDLLRHANTGVPNQQQCPLGQSPACYKSGRIWGISLNKKPEICNRFHEIAEIDASFFENVAKHGDLRTIWAICLYSSFIEQRKNDSSTFYISV